MADRGAVGQPINGILQKGAISTINDISHEKIKTIENKIFTQNVRQKNFKTIGNDISCDAWIFCTTTENDFLYNYRKKNLRL